MPKLVTLDKGQKQEILQLYQRGDATVAELAETYDVSTTWIYRLFKGNRVRPHRGVLVQGTPVPEETEVPLVRNNGQLAVVVDKHDIVQATHTVRRVGVTTWEIQYTGTVFIDAVDVEEAITEARKIGVVKRIYSVREKQ
jgi:transposase-like protein